jgi:hypothetical protein
MLIFTKGTRNHGLRTGKKEERKGNGSQVAFGIRSSSGAAFSLDLQLGDLCVTDLTPQCLIIRYDPIFNESPMDC